MQRGKVFTQQKKTCFLSVAGGARRPEADRDVPPGGRQAVHYGVVADH